MNNIKKNIPIIISLAIALLIIIISGLSTPRNDNIKDVYNVYLDGKLLGSVKSKNSLEKYIDDEQKELKKEFNVDKVYIPNGINIQKCETHKPKILTEKQIYDLIKEEKNFTIKGYVVTIASSDENNKKEDIKINILDKNVFDKAMKRVLEVFVNSKDVDAYENETQKEIKTTGSIIENIDIDEKITIAEAYISTDEVIFTDETTLSKYLLFGTLEDGEEYTVKPGDTIETVAFNNRLNVEEFLIVNPEFTSSNNLLSIGQKVSIALIDPIISVVVDKFVVEDMDKPYKTVEKDDSSMYVGESKVQTEGVNGRQRVSSKVQIVNGEARPSYITGTTVLVEPVDKVVLKGTKQYSTGYAGTGTPAVVTGDFGWPTISPYIITSYFEWRWGRMHEGIDISGCGMYSPIFSIANGTVISTTTECADNGYYGSGCGGGYGNDVVIDHGGGITVIYSHITSNVPVSVGQTVSRGQVVGYMGNSGSSTGTHLHFQVKVNGVSINPYTLYK